jgi:hypothetical protein
VFIVYATLMEMSAGAMECCCNLRLQGYSKVKDEGLAENS